MNVYRPTRNGKTSRLAIAFELCWIIFLLLVLKDWLLSAVTPYPYHQASIVGASLLTATSIVFRRRAISYLQRGEPAGPRTHAVLRIAGVFLSIVAGAELLNFLRGIERIPWNDDTLIGVGLGGHSLPANVLPAQSMIDDHIALETIAGEQGLLMIFALGALIVVSAAMTFRLLSVEPYAKKAGVLALMGLIGVDILLFRSYQGSVFLTFNTSWGTCALALCLACAGAAAQSVITRSSAVIRLGPRPTRTFAAYGLKIRIASILMVSALLSIVAAERELQALVLRKMDIGQQSISPLVTISRTMQDATVAMEDHAFYQHHGFDWVAMHHALRVDVREGQIKEGGSTITQQLAKNLFLTNDRTVLRKIEEAAYTWELEQMLPKSRILELYLNTIDYGMGQHGVTAAARYYFHKTPDKLTLAESAILVGIVPDPMQKQVDAQRLLDGQHTALSRVRYFFPDRYSQAECDLASWYPLNLLIYPDKDAWDRGATSQIRADWHGVKFYFFANPDEPLPIDEASRSLKNRLAGFLDDAHEHLHVVGIDHLGVYNDRSTRQTEKIISSHAYGQAIDISGFRFADGSRVSVKDHKNPKVMARLAPLEAMLKRHFDAVVDWNDEPKYHQTHFHTEVKGPRPTTPRPVQDPPAKGADEIMAEIRGTKRLPPRILTWLSGALVRQTTNHSCGEASVATILSDYLKRPTSEPQLIHRLDTENATGTGGEDLIRAFKAHGVQALENTVTPDELLDEIATTGLPAVVTLAHPAGHWIVVVGEWGDYLLISDPLRGNVLMPKNEFYARSDGETVSFERTKL